jgi:DNA-binding GntR family transcriptional regulator
MRSDPSPVLSEAIAADLRDRILNLRLAPGARLKEVHVAASLGVSRTPFREALKRLVTEGAVRDVPRKGYYVAPLTVEEVHDIYPMRMILDPAALRLAGLPSQIDLEQLRQLNARFGAARAAREAVKLDEAWHLELVGRCPNRTLLGLIRHFMGRTRRYELALLSEADARGVSTTEHDEIIDRLADGDLDGACEALRRNMESGKDPILQWLEQHAGAETPFPQAGA